MAPFAPPLCGRLCKGMTWLLIGCTRVKIQSEAWFAYCINTLTMTKTQISALAEVCAQQPPGRSGPELTGEVGRLHDRAEAQLQRGRPLHRQNCGGLQSLRNITALTL